MNSFDLYTKVIVPARVAVGDEPMPYRRFMARAMAALDDFNLVRFSVKDRATGRTVDAVSLTDKHVRIVLRKESPAVRSYANSLLFMPSASPRDSVKRGRILGFDTDDIALAVVAYNLMC